ncbi:hypothetical protein [Mesonia sp. K4-1]|uniref:hypothetical protein n=1 Tax=Mesonia sp. K4-1 TaxID=2602760 RepID=UPI0011C7B2BC|nr:hypothetical protein [Mesonia sp. K4-1]TXK77095.1 hypothetical protein FT986_05300 [Mesonia sp. K4-1]
MKKILILLFTIATISSCSNDDDSSTTQIIGEWKLMEAKFYGLEGGDSSEGSIDYSDQNIIYDFQANGTLTVAGGENAGYPNGTYEYFFGEDHLIGTDGPETLIVKVNESKWAYDLTNEKMTLGNSYVDGPDLVFERK